MAGGEKSRLEQTTHNQLGDWCHCRLRDHCRRATSNKAAAKHAPGKMPNYRCWSGKPGDSFLRNPFWQAFALLSGPAPWAHPGTNCACGVAQASARMYHVRHYALSTTPILSKSHKRQA
eukprot:1156229-Pelagomonas_calceolata.AAC.14